MSASDRFCSVCGAPQRDAEVAAARDPLIGATIANKYEVQARLGAGGMGVVYKVRHTALDRVAAMKLMHGDLARNASMVKRFHREARAVSRLSSRHTVSVFDYGQSAGLLYLVMELLTGVDLEEALLRSGPMEPARVSRIVSQVGASLSEAHAAGIVHRDIKPQNLFLVQEGTGELLKVLDFGLAKLTDTREENATETEMVIGTPRYMAPEQIAGAQILAQTDIYSLGCVTWEMLTGRPPFAGEKIIQILHGHTHGPVPDLSEVRPEYAALAPVLTRAMAKLPEDRFETVAQFAQALRAAVGTLSQPGVSQQRLDPEPVGVESAVQRATRDEFERWEQGMRLRRLLMNLAATAAGLGVLGAVGWVVTQSSTLRFGSEREPNNEIGDATPIALDTRVVGNLAPGEQNAADRDIYRVAAASGPDTRFMVDITAVGGVDLVVDLVYADGQRAVRLNSTGEGEPELLGGFSPRDSAFYIVVHANNQTTNPLVNYELRAWTRPAYDGEEREPNDSRSNSEELEPGQTVTAFVGWSDDQDVFRLPPVPQPMELMIAGLPGVSSAVFVLEEEFDAPSLQLDGVTISNGDWSTVIEPSSVPRWIAVRAVDGAFDARQPYFISLVPAPDVDMEPQREGEPAQGESDDGEAEEAARPARRGRQRATTRLPAE